jgi:membrane protein YdbS with pleckstrin-like domain
MDEISVTVRAKAGGPDDSERQLESPPEPQLESCGERRLDPEYVPFQRGVGWIVTASVSAALLATVGILWVILPRWVSVLLVPAWLLITLGIGWLSYVWPAVHYKYVSYALDAEGIEIRTGVWWRQVISVPRSRVQHIDVSQGPMERSYGLGRLVLYTAGTAHSRVELQGLSYAVAFALRNHLLPRGSDDAV